MDILFKTDSWVFSYRVAGICVENGCVLLQKPVDDTAFAFPGGHVALGETNAQTLIREFREETGLDISVGALKWVGESFFPWGKRSCHQIGLYYEVKINDSNIPATGLFRGADNLEFHWIPLTDVEKLEVYPTNAVQLLKSLDGDIQHFVYRE